MHIALSSGISGDLEPTAALIVQDARSGIRGTMTMLQANVLGNAILEQQSAMCPTTGTDGSSGVANDKLSRQFLHVVETTARPTPPKNLRSPIKTRP